MFFFFWVICDFYDFNCYVYILRRGLRLELFFFFRVLMFSDIEREIVRKFVVSF